VEPTVGPTAVIAPTLDAFHEAFPNLAQES
jgi:hypothetical protein